MSRAPTHGLRGADAPEAGRPLDATIMQHEGAPREWRFNEEDFVKSRTRHWRCPRALVEGGRWAQVWRHGETRRGGGIASAVLPVLSVHTWPGKRANGWTRLSYRRIAALSGVSKNSIRGVFEMLGSLGIGEQRRVPTACHYGPRYEMEYRLAGELYPTGTWGRYTRIPATLFYGGVWSILPTHAAQHLLIVIAALDPVHSPSALTTFRESNEEDESADQMVGRVRSREPVSLSELSQLSGLRRSTVQEALAVLRAPLTDGGTQLIVSGSTPRGTWYGRDEDALALFYDFAFLNTPGARAQIRRNRWPRRVARQHNASKIGQPVEHLGRG